MATEADRLLAEGQPIELADGTTINVRYGMRSIAMLEDRFGSVNAALDYAKDAITVKTELVKPTLALLVPGLSGYRDGDQPVYTDDRLLDLLDSRKLDEYLHAAMAALQDALPTTKPEGDSQGNAPSPEKTETEQPRRGMPAPGESTTTTMVDFPGPTSITSPPSTSDEPTASSG